jgi:CheY-like chemotaxis protein
MHQSHSQPSEALQFVHELVRAINENSTGAVELLEHNAQLWGELKRFLELIPAPANQTSPCKEVDLPTPTEQERLRKELLDNHLKYTFDNSTPDQKKQLREAVENFLAQFETPKQPPPETLAAAKLPPSDSIVPLIPADVHDLKVDSSDCAAGTMVPPASQPALPRWPAQPPLTPPTPMNGCNNSALVIEYNKSLSQMFTAFLKSDHYLVRTAFQSEDALRLYRECGPFEVVLIDYGMQNSIDIALDILKQDPTQPMIVIATHYQSEDEVPRRKELMNVPFLLDMSHLRKAIANLQPRATREEVDRAITALTRTELLRLKRYGDGRVASSRGTDYRTGQDLLQEAKRLTVEGHRCWKKRVSFFIHLIGVMRSITRRRKGDDALLACDTFKDDADGQEYCLFDNVTASDRNKFFGYASSEYDAAADQRLIATETMNQVFVQFMDDPEARLVLQGWSEGMKKKEIVQRGLSENRYRTAVKRIRMKLLTPTNGGGGGEKHDRQD